MSRSTRRAISWIGTLAVLAACAAGLAHLPGSGGVADELRWLLSTRTVRPQGSNRAFFLVREMDRRGRDLTGLFRRLLHDQNDLVVRRAMALIASPQTGVDPSARRMAATSEACAEWLAETTLADRVAHLPDSVWCWGHARHVIKDSLRGYTAIPGMSLTADERALLVAASVGRQLFTRMFVDAELFPGRWPANSLSSRLRYLDGLSQLEPSQAYEQSAGVAELLAIGRLQEIPSAALCEQVGRIDLDALLDMLASPIDQVRWGAGRILAVAGDYRGLPAFCDWLQHNPRMSANADKLMTALFGPDWGDFCASSSSARQSSSGDGGR